MDKIYIINPNSGNNKGKYIYKFLKNNILENEKVILTTKKGDAANIANEYKNGYIIYSIGGDGTLNEVVNGLVGGNSYLSIIPIGTGNDFYRSIEEQKDELFDINVGKVNNQFFINSICIGLDAKIAYNADKIRSKFIPKNMRYNIGIIECLLNYKNIDMIINNNIDSYTLFAITNGKYYGGGYKINPMANIKDKDLDLCFIKNLKLYEVPKLFLELKKGTHIEDKRVISKKIDYLKLECNEKVICNIDGESIIDNKFEIKIAEDKIKYYNIKDNKVKRLIYKLKNMIK